MRTRNEHRPYYGDRHNYPSYGNNNDTIQQKLPYYAKQAGEYIVRGLLYIQSILEMLIKSEPYIHQYGPFIKELPNIYKLMKAFQEENKTEENEPQESVTEEQKPEEEIATNRPILFV